MKCNTSSVENKVWLTSENWIHSRRMKLVCGIDLREMSWQTWTDCRVNTQLLFGPYCTLRLHDSLHVLLTQCALWWQNSFLSLAVHSLHSEARYAQLTPTDEFQTSWVLLTHYIDCLFKFDDSRKCFSLFAPPPARLTATHTDWWWLSGSKHKWKNWFETETNTAAEVFYRHFLLVL